MRTTERDYDDFFEKHITTFESKDLDPLSANVFRTYFGFSSYQYTQLEGDAEKEFLCCALYHLSFVDTFVLMEKIIILLMAANPSNRNQALYERFRHAFVLYDENRSTQYNDLKHLFCENKFQECAARCKTLLSGNAQYFEILDIYVAFLMTLLNMSLQGWIHRINPWRH